jgi:2-iminobutanoate/2-iminopropanoate deaminase
VCFPLEDWERPLFSQMVIVDRTIYLSGMMGVGPPDRYIVPGGIQPESRQAMENIRSALARVGARMDDIVKCTIFLVDVADRVSMNQVYPSFFSGDLPARSAGGGGPRRARESRDRMHRGSPDPMSTR